MFHSIVYLFYGIDMSRGIPSKPGVTNVLRLCFENMECLETRNVLRMENRCRFHSSGTWCIASLTVFASM